MRQNNQRGLAKWEINTKNQYLQLSNSQNMNKIVSNLYPMVLSKKKLVNSRKNLYLPEEIFSKMTVRLRLNLPLERWLEEWEVYCKEVKRKKDNKPYASLLPYHDRSNQAKKDYLQLNRIH